MQLREGATLPEIVLYTGGQRRSFAAEQAVAELAKRHASVRAMRRCSSMEMLLFGRELIEVKKQAGQKAWIEIKASLGFHEKTVRRAMFVAEAVTNVAGEIDWEKLGKLAPHITPESASFRSIEAAIRRSRPSNPNRRGRSPLAPIVRSAHAANLRSLPHDDDGFSPLDVPDEEMDEEAGAEALGEVEEVGSIDDVDPDCIIEDESQPLPVKPSIERQVVVVAGPSTARVPARSEGHRNTARGGAHQMTLTEIYETVSRAKSMIRDIEHGDLARANELAAGMNELYERVYGVNGDRTKQRVDAREASVGARQSASGVHSRV